MAGEQVNTRCLFGLLRKSYAKLKTIEEKKEKVKI